MVRLYLDEDVNVLLASLLRARNIRVSTTLEHNMLGKSDREQLFFAKSLDAAIVTHNRSDFERLFHQCIESGASFSGIIVLIRRDVREMVRRLSRFCLSHESIENQLWYI